MEVLQNKKISLFSRRYSGPSQVRAAMASIVPILGLISQGFRRKTAFHATHIRNTNKSDHLQGAPEIQVDQLIQRNLGFPIK